MSEVNDVPGPARTDVRIDPSPSASPATPNLPVDTGPVARVGPPPQSMPALPPSPSAIDYGLAASAANTISQNALFDVSHIAAVLMLIDSELRRNALDTQVEQIKSVADQTHAAAADIRESAKLALAGGVVSGASQIASAGISVGGGIKGMSLTSGAAATEAGTGAASASSGLEEPASTNATSDEPEGAPRTAAAAQELPVTDGEGTSPAESQVEETPGETTRETVKEMSAAKQKAAATRLDHTMSQQLSARAQNVALTTEGLAKMSSASGELIKSALDYESRQKEADSKDAEAKADELRAYLERTKGFADAMQKGAQDMLQIYQQVEDSGHQTRKQIWHA